MSAASNTRPCSRCSDGTTVLLAASSPFYTCPASDPTCCYFVPAASEPRPAATTDAARGELRSLAAQACHEFLIATEGDEYSVSGTYEAGYMDGYRHMLAASPQAPESGVGDFRACTDEEEAAVDAALGLEKVTLRLPVQWVQQYRTRAEHLRVSFPAYLRELLEPHIPDVFEREATSQSADQPVAWQFKHNGEWLLCMSEKHYGLSNALIPVRPLYAHPSPSATVTEAMVYAAVRSVGVTANPREWNRLMAKTLTAALRAGDER